MTKNGSWKQAVDSVTEREYACYDLRPWQGNGHVILTKEGETYEVEGIIDDVKVNVGSSEEGLPRILQELNIDPTSGWYTF